MHIVILAGELGKLPAPKDLADAGVKSFSGEDLLEKDMDGRASAPQRAESMTAPGPSQQVVSTRAGLPSLPKKTVDKIRSNEYIDFAELPPARGKSRQLPQVLDGQVIVSRPSAVQESDHRPGNVESTLCSLCGSWEQLIWAQPFYTMS